MYQRRAAGGVTAMGFPELRNHSGYLIAAAWRAKRGPSKAEAPEAEYESKGAKGAKGALDPGVISPLYTVGKHLKGEHKSYEPWSTAMREMVPEATEPYLDHVWKMLTPAAESKAAKKQKSDGVTGAEATERPEGSGAGPERRDRPDAHEGRAGGGTDRGSAPSARGIVLARPEFTRPVRVERTPEALRAHLSDDQQQAAEMAGRSRRGSRSRG